MLLSLLYEQNPQINVSIAIQYPSANFDRITHPAIAFNFSQAYLTLNATLMSYDLSRGKTLRRVSESARSKVLFDFLCKRQLNERFSILTVIFNFSTFALPQVVDLNCYSNQQGSAPQSHSKKTDLPRVLGKGNVRGKSGFAVNRGFACLKYAYYY